MKLRKKNRGFTLVELIVVIAILAILAAIAVPQLLGFQQRAREQADNQTAAQLKNAFALLFSNNEVILDDDITDTVYTTATDEATFEVTASNGTATVSNLSGDNLYDSSGTGVDAADLKAKIEELMKDVNIQSGNKHVLVTINGAGAVSAILETETTT